MLMMFCEKPTKQNKKGKKRTSTSATNAFSAASILIGLIIVWRMFPAGFSTVSKIILRNPRAPS